MLPKVFDKLSPNGVGFVFGAFVFPIILSLSKGRLSPNGVGGVARLGKVNESHEQGHHTVKQTFLNFEHRTTQFSMMVACLMLVIASGLGMFQIITRFVLEQPAEWSEILIRLSLIWMVFMGIPMAFRQGAMVSVDVLYRWSSPRIKRVLDAVVCVAALALVSIILWWGWDYAVRGRVQSMAGLESLSMFWGYVAMPVGAAFSLIGIVANYLDPQDRKSVV